MGADNADEYCFLYINQWWTCMTLSDWSSWVQAIGTIMALAIAIEIARRDSRQRKREARARALAAIRAQGDALQLLGRRLHEYIDLQRARQEERRAEANRTLDLVKDYLREVRAIDRDIRSDAPETDLSVSRQANLLLAGAIDRCEDGAWLDERTISALRTAEHFVNGAAKRATNQAQKIVEAQRTWDDAAWRWAEVRFPKVVNKLRRLRSLWRRKG